MGQGSKATGPQDDARDKAGRSDTKPHRRSKTRRPVRRDNVVRPRGHRTTDAIRRAGAKRSHTDEQKKTRRSVRRDKVVRPRGRRTTDAIRRAGATRSHTDEQKRDGWSKGSTLNRVLGDEYRHKHVRAGTVIFLFEGRGVPTRRTRGKIVTQGIKGGGGRGNVSVTEEVSHRAGFYKVGCTLISISLRWGPDPKQTPTTPLILNIIYFINPFTGNNKLIIESIYTSLCTNFHI